MPWPVGVDLPASDVEVVVVTDPAGHLRELASVTGPAPLVEAVRTALPGCVWPPSSTVRQTFRFPDPPVVLVGELRGRGRGDPLASRTLVIGDRTVTTDAEGRFELRNLAPGDHPVRLVDPDWRLPDAAATVSPGRRTELVLWAAHTAVETELVARYSDPDVPTIEARTVALDEATATPGTLGDPLRALAGQPGLTRAPFDAGWLLVRGGDYDETGLFVEGVRVPLVVHLGGFTSILHPELVDRVDFWPGPFPARYGQALSGVVDLRLREVGERASAAVGANVVFASVWAETPTPFGGVAVAARRSYLDGILALAVGSEAAGIAPRFWDAELHATIGEGWLTVFGLSDAIDAPSFDGQGTLAIGQQAVQVQAKVPVGPIELRPYLFSMNRDVVGEDDSDVEPQSVGELTPGLRVSGTAEADGAALELGFEGQRRAFSLTRETAESGGAVWSAEPYAGGSVGERTRLWTEVRASVIAVEDDPDQPVRSALSPRGGVSHRAAPWLELHGSFGRVSATPTPTLWLGIADGAYLDLERSEQVTAGARLGEGVAVGSVDLWTRQSHALAELELDGSVAQAAGRADGVETSLAVRRAGFSGTALFQLTRSQKREDPDDAFAPSAFEVPVRVEVAAVQALPRAWEVAARFRATSGFPRVLGYGPTSTELVLQPTEAYDLLLQETVDLGLPADRLRLAPYHALDLRVAHTASLRRMELVFGLDLQNVYNRRVVEPVVTGFGESRPSYGFGLPILPVFSVDAKWWPGGTRFAP